MVTKARLILGDPNRRDDTVRLSARLLHANGSTDDLWWELPARDVDAVTPWADPWIIGLLFPAMQAGAPVHVEGRVSPSLLANLELFMRIFAQWLPGKYRPVEYSADAEIELPQLPLPGKTVASFSNGVDSCFTVLRHRRGLAGRNTHHVDAAVVQHGFDIWLDQVNSDGVFTRMLADARTMLNSLGVPCIPLKSNFQQMRLEWEDAWVTLLVGGMYLLAGRFDTALLGNDIAYTWLGEHLSSHPATNPLLGSQNFKVIDDGGEFSRVEKARLISAWPEAMRHLRVCFGVAIPGTYGNCCECEKCIRTILAFRIAGCERPSAFEKDVTDERIRLVRLTASTKVQRWRELANEAAAAGLAHTDWARSIRAVLRRERWRHVRNRLLQPFVPWRDRIRRLVRGTSLSRSELATLRRKGSNGQIK
jgi:hypothetical protein